MQNHKTNKLYKKPPMKHRHGPLAPQKTKMPIKLSMVLRNQCYCERILGLAPN
jgi:hypothetical protein